MKRHLFAWLVAFGLVLVASSSAHAAVVSLYAGDHLFVGQGIIAPHCGARLTFQADGNLVLFDASNRAVWATNTFGRGGAYAAMEANGDVEIYTWSGNVLWHSKTVGNPAARLDLQDDGNLVIRRVDGSAAWTSFTGGERLGSSSCPASALTSTEIDINRFGGDYAGFDIAQPIPLWCAYYCSQDSRCQSYSYVPPFVQGPLAKCWLKDSVPATSYAPGLMSGVIFR